MALLARSIAAKWGAADWGYYAGLWHDLGKFAPDWQEFLDEVREEASVTSDDGSPVRAGRRRGPDHSTAGAVHVGRVFGDARMAQLLQFVIAAHHAGLSNEDDLKLRVSSAEKLARYEMARAACDPEIAAVAHVPSIPAFLKSLGGTPQKRAFEFLTRMIFSSLVDADFLDTEAFMEKDGERSTQRRGWPRLNDYVGPLDRHLAELSSSNHGSVNVRTARNRVLQWCRDASDSPRGKYSLTVPTGGGKTLASLAFALTHAERHRLDRVIIVLPFLSIIDQTARVLRKIYGPLFGDRALIEHHSSVRPAHDTARNRVASENWDGPLIVTTQVQFFESLFARRPSDCRKLHNIANSVVILDEVQTLPIGLLDPTLDALQELSSNYGTSLLLTTATQPSLDSRQLGPIRFAGLQPAPHEIVPPEEIEELFDSLRRVDVLWPTPANGDSGRSAVDWPSLADRLMAHRQVLAIVHRREDARKLWGELEARCEGPLHLSALMCPQHRGDVIERIHASLNDNQVCRVVSTQLVEAGVDIDFPIVFRAMAGLESLAQSAGRCNRNGILSKGRFEIFEAPTPPPKSLRLHKQLAETMLNLARINGEELDLFSPETFRTYFDRLYGAEDRDQNLVQQSRQLLRFEDTAKAYRMIPDEMTTILVKYAGGADAISRFRDQAPNRDSLRHLQPFGVSVYETDLKNLQDRGAIELIHETAWVLVDEGDYDGTFGLKVAGDEFGARFA